MTPELGVLEATMLAGGKGEINGIALGEINSADEAGNAGAGDTVALLDAGVKTKEDENVAEPFVAGVDVEVADVEFADGEFADVEVAEVDAGDNA